MRTLCGLFPCTHSSGIARTCPCTVHPPPLFVFLSLMDRLSRAAFGTFTFRFFLLSGFSSCLGFLDKGISENNCRRAAPPSIPYFGTINGSIRSPLFYAKGNACFSFRLPKVCFPFPPPLYQHHLAIRVPIIEPLPLASPLSPLFSFFMVESRTSSCPFF